LVAPRRGASSLGCLFTLLIVAAVVYFGINVGEIYWRYYEYQDDMKQEVRFAANVSTENIILHLKAAADTLDLPVDAKVLTVRRSPREISIEAEYYERIELPMYARDVLFHPHATGPL
jgi:hypothetical protein